MTVVLRSLIVVLVLTSFAFAQDETQLSYDQIVSSASSVDEGGITVFNIEGQYLAELPPAAFERDLLWYAELGKSPPGATTFLGVIPIGNTLGDGQGRLIRLQRSGSQVLVLDYTATQALRGPSSLEMDDSDDEKFNPLDVAVGQATQPAILIAFPIIAESNDGNPVIELSSLFAGDIGPLSAAAPLSQAGLQPIQVDPTRSFVTRVSSYPENIFITNLLTFITADGGAVSVETKHTILLLPTEPMRPRIFDPRVGYFNFSFKELTERGTTQHTYIVRHRLEKQDPSAAISDPVEPIIYYLGPGIPDVWRPYMKEAIEGWNVAFEAAGFSNAVQVLDAPTPEEDPEWDPGDARYNVIRWLADPAANAMGPNLHDPRTGEVISNHILLWPEVVSLAESWYYAMVSPLDPAAQQLPLSDETLGRMMGYIVAHEVGHALGLRHNHRGSTAYTVAELRDPTFTCENGSTSSIMAYGRLNYVAQPEDGIPPECLMPRVAPYDVHAIKWGYIPIDAATPEEELPLLEDIAKEVETNDWLQYGTDEEAVSGVDPYVLMQNVGRERVEATALGLENLKRIMASLEASESSLEEKLSAYSAVLQQRNSIVKSVLNVVGGVSHIPTYNADTVQYEFIPASEQRAAVAFLTEQVLGDDDTFIPAAFLNGLVGPGALDLFLSQQRVIVIELIAPERFQRLAEAAMRSPETAYAATDFLRDLQSGLWGELRGERVSVSSMRRDLQTTYLATLNGLLHPQASEADALGLGFLEGGLSDFELAVMDNVTALKVQLLAAQPKASDTLTASHLRHALNLVNSILSD